MTNSEIRIAVAECLGARWCFDSFSVGGGRLGYLCFPNKKPGGFKPVNPADGKPIPSPHWAQYIPDYPSDLNACAEMEKTLNGETDEEWNEYVHQLFALAHPHDDCCSFEGHGRAFLQATAQQRCIAFLKTKGRWKE